MEHSQRGQPRHSAALQPHRAPVQQDSLKCAEQHQRPHGRLPLCQRLHRPGEPPCAGGRHLPHPTQQTLGLCLHCQHHTQRPPHWCRLPGKHLHVRQPDVPAHPCSVALQGRDAVCGSGSIHLQFAAHCCGALHHHDEATATEVDHKELLSNLRLGGALLGLGAGDRLPPLAGLELRVQPGQMLYSPSSLLQDLHPFFPSHLLGDPAGYRRALWCHLLPCTQERPAGPSAQPQALLGSAENRDHHRWGLYALLGATVRAATGGFLLRVPPVCAAVQR